MNEPQIVVHLHYDASPRQGCGGSTLPAWVEKLIEKVKEEMEHDDD